jgi:hypothetical protein
MFNVIHLKNIRAGDIVQGYSISGTHKAMGWISSILKQNKHKFPIMP